MTTVTINRAPVLTLWAAVVAERLGFDHDEALTLGRPLAGMNAFRKGALGLFEPAPRAIGERRRHSHEGDTIHVALMHRAIPVVRTPEGCAPPRRTHPSSRPPSNATSPASSAPISSPPDTR